jgi:hypothetical protein
VLPTLPSALVDDREIRRESRLQIKAVEDKNVRMAERILAEAKKALTQRGFHESSPLITNAFFWGGFYEMIEDACSAAKRDREYSTVRKAVIFWFCSLTPQSR